MTHPTEEPAGPHTAVKQPAECSDLSEIRTEIDRLDRQIIAHLGQRLHYVRAAAAFKTSETAVRAPDRVASMLDDRRRWAVDEGLDPEVISEMYRTLVEYFTDDELRRWSQHD